MRGLDYYMRTTFELVHDGLGAQSASAAAGATTGSRRPSGPAAARHRLGARVDRTLLALRAEGARAAGRARPQVFVVPLGAAAKACAVALVGALRRDRVAADLAYGDRGMKGAMKAADRSGAPFAVVLGDRDLEAGIAQVKDLSTGEQAPVPLDDLVPTLKERLNVIRTHQAGALREEHAGTTVTLAGWVARRRDHGGVAFLDLRDGSGVVQVVVRECDRTRPARRVLRARHRRVRVRPEGNRNDALPTGAVEVAATTVEVLRAPPRCPSRSTTTCRSATRCA